MAKKKNAIADIVGKKIESLEYSKNVLLEYVYEKLGSNDLHGAIDGLMDMRDIDSEIKQLREIGALADGGNSVSK